MRRRRVVLKWRLCAFAGTLGIPPAGVAMFRWWAETGSETGAAAMAMILIFASFVWLCFAQEALNEARMMFNEWRRRR